MGDEQSYRDRRVTELIREYHAAGNMFDRLYQRLLGPLQDARHAGPDDLETAGLGRATGAVDRPARDDPPLSSSSVVIDDSGLLDYAGRFGAEIGVVVVDVLRDPGSTLVTSPLALLRVMPALHGTPAEGTVRKLLAVPAIPVHDGDPVAHVPDLTRTEVDLIIRLNTGERPDIVHTALLALRWRCWIATHHPAVYHQLGYLRTLALAPGMLPTPRSPTA
jgi:hypothetical protein